MTVTLTFCTLVCLHTEREQNVRPTQVFAFLTHESINHRHAMNSMNMLKYSGCSTKQSQPESLLFGADAIHSDSLNFPAVIVCLRGIVFHFNAYSLGIITNLTRSILYALSVHSRTSDTLHEHVYRVSHRISCLYQHMRQRQAYKTDSHTLNLIVHLQYQWHVRVVTSYSHRSLSCVYILFYQYKLLNSGLRLLARNPNFNTPS